MTRCERLKQLLDGTIEMRRDIMQALGRRDLPASERAELIADLKDVNRAIAELRRRYEECLRPPVPRPDLEAWKFQIRRQGSMLSVAGVLRNIGDAPAHGPFKVVLGASTATYTRALTVQIPSDVTIEGHGTEYTTPRTLDNIPVSNVELHMLVDSDHEVTERLESNNALNLRFWFNEEG